jgi:integrase
MVYGERRTGHLVSVEKCEFDTRADSKTCKLPSKEDAGTSFQIPTCPKGCKTGRVYHDGNRYTSQGALIAYRYICTRCGYRFSYKVLKSAIALSTSRRICADGPVKNLVSAAEIKTVAGVTETSLIDYAWKLKKKGRNDSTIRIRCSVLSDLIRKGAHLNNTDSVETILAVESQYNDIEKRSKKHLAIMAYQSYCKVQKIFWEPIKDNYQPKEAFIAAPDELKLFINSAGHRLGTYLQVTHDTGARRGEVCHTKYADVNTVNHTISINQPEKGSLTRTIKIPEATIARIQSLDRKYDPYIFCPNSRTYTDQFEKLRYKVCRENPFEADRLGQIHLHTFRYGFAHRLLKQLRPQKEVQQKLGHKSSKSTDRYTNTVVFNDLDFETARATTVEEAEKLGSQGYTKYDEICGVHLYRRIKA